MLNQLNLRNKKRYAPFFKFTLLPLFLIFGLSCEEPEHRPDEELEYELDVDSLHINQIQVIGSHNSYRIQPPERLLNLITAMDSAMGRELDYTHLPLDEQFDDYGIRQIELDIYHDPDGGLFYWRFGNLYIQEPMESGLPELNEPGLKVLHFPDFDYNTHYLTFKEALLAVKSWSEANPNHVPIFILIEAKEEGVADILPGLVLVTYPLSFGVGALDSIDLEIREVFGEDLQNVITPDDVRGNHETLEEAILTDGWPTLGESRGKVMFALDNGGEIRDLYVENHPSLQGRVLFTSSDPGTPEAAFLKMNTPTEEIADWEAQGHIVRTRSDADTEEARSGDVTRRDLALSVGAHFVSTDYYKPDHRYPDDEGWTDYYVSLPGGVTARLNPVNGPEEYTDLVIE